MLNTPAPFPQPGSYALYEDAGRTQLVRIQHRDPANRQVIGEAATALISFPRTYAASGNRTVPLADLIDGTPLSGAERATMTALEAALAGKAVSTRSKKYKTYMALRARDISSETLAQLMERAGLKTSFQAIAA